MKKTILLALSCCLIACSSPSSKKELPSEMQNDQLALNTSYAEKFNFLTEEKYILLTVHTPWQRANDISYQYVLSKKNAPIPDSLKELPHIIIPVENAVVMSTTYVPFIDTLGELESIKGVSGLQYLFNKELQNLHPADVGFEQSINYETLIHLQPDVVFLYGIQSGVSETIRKLEELGLNPIVCADYLESEPLGRSEWLKFFSLFYQKLDEANTIFEDIEQKYMSLKREMVSENAPSVLLGLPWKDAWYIAGGNSYAANLIEDAGGIYLWNDLETKEALAYDIEAVVARALDAEYWINPGVATSKNDILFHDERFQEFQAFKSNNIYNNNKRVSEAGGNDYWESGILHPEWILQDLCRILSNEETGTEALHYYQRIE